MGTVCQQLLQHVAQRLHAACVLLVEPGLELVVEPADELLRGLLVSHEAALQGGQALVQVGAKVMSAAIQLFLKRVELRLDIAHSLELLHS